MSLTPESRAPSTRSPQAPLPHHDVGHDNSGLSRPEELCLVHHYVTSTDMQLSRHQYHSDVWKSVPFHDGAKYEFVLDAVLAIAALNKAQSNSSESEKYTSACLYYQNRTIREYQARLSSINDENCHAMFAVSALINVITFAMSRGTSSLPPTPPLETLLTSYKLLEGVKVVLHDRFEKVKLTQYGSLFNAPKLPEDHTLSEEASHALHELHQRAAAVASPSASSINIETYTQTIKSLQESFRQAEHKHVNAVVAWPLIAGEKAIDLLKAGDPTMMLIFVHYGVLYLHVDDRWWARDFGRRLIWDLSESLHALSASWMPSTSWARAQAAKVHEDDSPYSQLSPSGNIS